MRNSLKVKKLLVLMLQPQLCKCTLVWMWAGLMVSGGTTGIGSGVGDSGAALSSRSCLWARGEVRACCCRCPDSFCSSWDWGVVEGLVLLPLVSATHQKWQSLPMLPAALAWMGFPSWSDLDAFCFHSSSLADWELMMGKEGCEVA